MIPLGAVQASISSLGCYQLGCGRVGHLPLTFIGLDVTYQVLLRKNTLESMIQVFPKSRLLKFIQGISAKYMDFYYGNDELPGCYLHDPLAVGYVINPAFLEVKPQILHVETVGELTSGVIFPDDRPTRNPAWRNPAEEVINVACDLEREAFEEFFISKLI
ncbi:MAG: nucleoside hydrolase [Candidatus Marinimicrobia bacterium]|nr:nucleoside hydrolase [Candidatus Neomarinimicrobiota bacterium]